MAARKIRRPRTRRSGAPPARETSLLEQATQIWMAGVAALARAQKQGPKMVESLVREGLELTSRTRAAAQKALRAQFEGVQGVLESRVREARDQAAETVDHLEQLIQTRIHRALHQLGVPTADQLNRLTRRVNELNHNVEKLARMRRRPRKRATVRAKRAAKGAAAAG